MGGGGLGKRKSLQKKDKEKQNKKHLEVISSGKDINTPNLKYFTFCNKTEF